MQKVYFKQLSEHICRDIQTATRSIRVAVCWFTHKEIFENILERLQAGVRIEILIEYDDRNIHENGLDFKQFIRKGGQLYAYQEAGLMHHKFALIDGQLLLNGSFNWTYNSNAENLCATADPPMIAAFNEAFESLKKQSKRIFTIKPEEVRRFSSFPLFENTHFDVMDLRKKISGGANVWVVDMDKIYGDASEGRFKGHLLFFDREQHLNAFWTAWRSWNAEYAVEELKMLQLSLKPATWRELRLWFLRMKIGDVVVAIDREAYIRRIGVVQSHPQCCGDENGSSFRDVQWLALRIRAESRVGKVKAGIGKYKESALRLVQEALV